MGDFLTKDGGLMLGGLNAISSFCSNRALSRWILFIPYRRADPTALLVRGEGGRERGFAAAFFGLGGARGGR